MQQALEKAYQAADRANASTEDVRHSKEGGMNRHIAKPRGLTGCCNCWASGSICFELSQWKLDDV